MRESHACPQCESPYVGVLETAIWAESLDGGGFNGMKTVPTKTWLCHECGYAQQYLATLPKERENSLESQLKLRWLLKPPEVEGPYR